MKTQNKIKRGVKTLEHFTLNEWEFTNTNLCLMMNEMNETDTKVAEIILVVK